MTAKTDISKCLSLLFGKLKLCISLSFIVFCLLQPTANYDLAIIEDYLAGNAKIKISIKKTKWRRCHIRRALATVANRKCGPENIHCIIIPNCTDYQLSVAGQLTWTIVSTCCLIECRRVFLQYVDELSLKCVVDSLWTYFV